MRVNRVGLYAFWLDVCSFKIDATILDLTFDLATYVTVC